jgi:hypothetical protein
MKAIFQLPVDKAIAHEQIELLKRQRGELQAKIDTLLAIPLRPIHEADTAAGRSAKEGFNQFRSLAHDILSGPEETESDRS